MADDYRKNKLVLERNSRRLSNIHSKEKDELIKDIRSRKNKVEADILEKDKEIRQLHETIGEITQELATTTKQVSELSKKVSLDDSDAKKGSGSRTTDSRAFYFLGISEAGEEILFGETD